MPSIPNYFHFVFGLQKQTEPFHLVHYLCLESCIQINRPERIYLYFHFEPYGKYWDMIKEKLTLIRVDLNSFVASYTYQDSLIKKYRYAHQSDFVRLEQLLQHGGVYADIDTIFVNPIPSHLFDKPCVLGREHDVPDPKTKRLRPSLCNAVIMSEPQGEFLRTWFAQLKHAFDGTWSNHSTFLPYQLSQQYPHLIHIEAIRSFFYHGPNPEGISTLFQQCDTNFSGIYSMHLWSHLWWSWRRRDFSTFYAGQLREGYIRDVDTTYNVVARQYLPSQPRPNFFSRIKEALSK